MAGEEGRLAWRKSEQAVSRSPEAWIGRQVVLGIGTQGARLSGELKEVSDRGVVLHYGTETG